MTQKKKNSTTYLNEGFISQNRKIGKNTIIAAMTGISGSVKIGD